jgi:hypothetical protein
MVSASSPNKNSPATAPTTPPAVSQPAAVLRTEVGNSSADITPEAGVKAEAAKIASR